MSMKTERLFYENVYLREFTARVLFCGEEERGCYVILDRTAFYPEGGGQPADTGVLLIPSAEAEAGSGNVAGERTAAENRMVGEKNPKISVRDVQYVGDEIRHYVDVLPEVGSQVRGCIDWDRRFDLMQQHSGEHLVSGCIHSRYGYDNVGFHMGEDVITVDVNGLLDEKQLLEIEKQVNRYIWSNRPVRVFFPDEEERNRLPYRSKKELTGEVRLVEFPGGDLCACCGLHVEAAGEIGLVKLLSVKHFRQGVRMEMVAGGRAMRILHQHKTANSQVAAALSVKPEETPEAVRRLQEEIFALKGQITHFRQERFALRAEQCAGKGNVLLLEQGLSSSDIQKEADAVLDVCGGICAVISLEGNGQGKGGPARYAVGQRDGDVRALVQEMNGKLQGRGGGRPFFAQGSLQAEREQIRTFFAGKGFRVLCEKSSY